MTHHSHTQQCACNVRADFDIIIGARTTSLSSLESLLPTQARRWCVLSALRRAQERAAARNFGPSTLAAQLTAVLAAVLSFFTPFVYLFLISVIVFWSLAVRFGYRMRSWPCSWTLSWLRSCFVFARSSTFVVVGLELDNGSFPRRGLHFAFSMRREVV